MSSVHRQEEPSSISVGQMKIEAGLWIGSFEQPILGLDVIMQFVSTLNISEGMVMWQIGQLQGSTVHPLWPLWIWNQCA
jgi:hypothetical protein